MPTLNTDRLRLRAAALALAAVFSLTLSRSDAAFADAVVQKLSGRVEVGRGEPPVWTTLAPGSPVRPNERIRTGPDGRVELALEGSTLRVHENSLLALPPATEEAIAVELEAGHSLFDVLRREGRRFEVHTPTVVVSVKGTRFGVEAGGEAGVVSVYRGVVGVRSAYATDATGATEASEVVETLVREGFLATGGGERPFELDVVPPGDPWSAWQTLQTGGTSPSAGDAPQTELERARASLRRATDVEVLKRAAERRPEIAERLRQQTAETKSTPAEDRDAKGSRDEPGPVPAAPAIFDSLENTDPGGRDAPDKRGDRLDSGGGLSIDTPEARDHQRDILDLRRVDGSLKAVDSVVDVPTLTGGTPLTNGGTTLSTDHLASFDPREVMLLMNALQELQAASDSLARPWTQNEMASYLEGQLVTRGLPLAEAQALVQGLFR
ncbi:MAG: FecR domain-containing protein [Deltaproteobacteria bacterium]|nr:FecR domain-containing protein [Deltaproteobacteria bacterium]